VTIPEALRFKRDRDRDRLQELADRLEEEHGPVTEGERAAALEELDGLDAEQQRRAGVVEERGRASRETCTTRSPRNSPAT
jgi:hypothetical protein